MANLPGYAIALAFLYIVVRVSGIKFSYLAKGVKPLRFIIIFTFILNLFFVQGETPIFHAGLFHADEGSAEQRDLFRAAPDFPW